MPVKQTARERKLLRYSPAKKRQIARAIYAQNRRSPSRRGKFLADTLQRSATRQLKRRRKK